MEIIISIVILSVVIVSLLQLKVNNIFLTSKSEVSKENLNYILMAINSNEVKNRDENIYLKDIFTFDDTLRKKIKDKKINVKDELLENIEIKKDDLSLNIDIYSTKYTLDKTDNSKIIYSFKLNY